MTARIAIYPHAPDLGREPPAWMAEALCAQVGTELFFPQRGSAVADPKRVCARCAVRVECLDDAMAVEDDYSHGHGYRHGVYGGMSAIERARLALAGWTPGDPTPPVRIYGRVIASAA